LVSEQAKKIKSQLYLSATIYTHLVQFSSLSMTNKFVAAAPLSHSSSSLAPPSMSAATASASLAAAEIELPQTSSLDVMTTMTKVPAIIPLPNTQQVISLKLSNINFLYWRMRMKPFLLGQGIFPFVDGSLPCPPSNLISVDTSLLLLMLHICHGSNKTT
jgi:hypothetical protein